jgi:uncharacterized membrane protein YgdD (TMEM256/DUF423 family)
MPMLAGCLFAVTAVVLGAFGAHGLKDRIATEQLQSFETGVRYQLFHAIALLFLGLLSDRLQVPALRYVSYLFILGILLFSGSIYLLATRDLIGIGSFKNVLGPVTPLGGLSMIAGWCMLTYLIVRSDLI